MGTSQNGVTNYPVEVTIDEPGKLMSGMNVSAEIIVAEAANVVRAPISAVNYFNGSYYVSVVGEVAGMSDNRGGRPQGNAIRGGAADGEQSFGESRPGGEGAPEGAPAGETPGKAAAAEKTPGEDAPVDGADSATAKPMDGAGNNRGNRGDSSPNITMFDEEQRVEVTVGISDEDYYEIISGLEVGQVVRDTGSSRSRGFGFGMMGGMGGFGGGMGGGPGGGGRR